MSALRMPALANVVAVRLNCRFSNGLTMSYMVRAMEYDEKILKVLSKEKFDTGIALTAVCSLFSGAAVYRVAKTELSTEHQGYFVVELKLKEQPKAAAPEKVPDWMRLAAAEVAAQLAGAEAGAPVHEALKGVNPGQVNACMQAAATALLLLAGRKGVLDTKSLARSLGGA